MARLRREQPRARLGGRALRRSRRDGETPIGLVPAAGAIDTSGLDVSPEAMEKLLEVDPDDWREQLPQLHEHFATFGDRLPDELARQLEALEARVEAGELDDVALAPLRSPGGER